MRPVSVVVLSKYKEVLRPFLETFQKFVLPEFEQNKNHIVFVLDGDRIDPITCAGLYSIIVKGPEKFSMAGNGNLGWKAVPLDHDILYVGDDIRFLEPKTIKRLQEVAYSDEKIGVLSPRLIGRGSPKLINPSGELCEVRPLEMWFPCVYIKREVIDKIGYLDEQFNDFGSDDLDFCIRTKMAGYNLACTSKVTVMHQASPEGGPTTFCKNVSFDEYKEQELNSYGKLQKKWGVSENAFTQFMMTGDVKFLEPTRKAVIDISNLDSTDVSSHPSKEAVDEFFRSRKIHVATPCYGGQMTMNYTQSVMSLNNLCTERGINFSISFLANESLINRARNRMVAESRVRDDFTDFFFIDADIGFDPRDILALLLYDKDIIGAPCVRKNLRLDRVVAATKKRVSERILAMGKAGASIEEIAEASRNGQDYTLSQLEEMLGEYVVNWPPGKIPKSMKIERILEVQDIGTGLMKIKRETFDKFEAHYPERVYWSLVENTKTNERNKMFMFFQSRLDENAKEFNPDSLPDYIPEDYAFCRDARKAGMGVWLAPWMKTTHFGTYSFKGDLMATAQSGGGLR